MGHKFCIEQMLSLPGWSGAVELLCGVRSGVSAEETSVAWDNLEETVLKIGLNIDIHVGRLTGSITCGRGREGACADAPVLDKNRGLGEQCQWPTFQVRI